MSVSATDHDSQNIEFATDDSRVEKLLTAFHEVLPWPWKPVRLRFPLDADFFPRALNSALGYLRDPIVPASGARIWVAGSGIVQAVQTALDYPDAQVVGSNISHREVVMTQEIATQVDVPNLEIREESINTADHRGEFDYIICTGVLHHQARPAEPLRRMTEALKPHGVLELMVYNRFHRFATSAFQKAIQILTNNEDLDHVAQLRMARALIAAAEEGTAMGQLRDKIDGMPDVSVGDALIYPVEHSYTVRTLFEMAADCGLRLFTPRTNAFDEMAGTGEWELTIADPDLDARYHSLCDEDRWYLTNLLRLERSPLLWFFAHRHDCPRPAADQATVCHDFLTTVFDKHTTTLGAYQRDRDDAGTYRLIADRSPFPARPPHPDVRDIFGLVDGVRPMAEIFAELGRPTDVATVSRTRALLTSMQFPYLTPA